MLHVLQAKHIEEYMIQVTFNDGTGGVANVMDKIFQDKREIVQSLKDVALFKSFTVKAHTIT